MRFAEQPVLFSQICDDKVFCFVSRMAARGPEGERPETALVAYEWTTGQMLFVSSMEPPAAVAITDAVSSIDSQEILCVLPNDRSNGFSTMEDFILISHQTFGTVNYSASRNFNQNRLTTSLDVQTLLPNPEWEALENVDEKDIAEEERERKRNIKLRTPRSVVKMVARFLLPVFHNIVHIGE